MATSLVGKTTLITGAYGGIGYAIASRFASEGSRLVLLGRDENKLRHAAEGLARKHAGVFGDQARAAIRIVACDVAKPDDWQRAISGSGGIDVMVNCAGVAQESLLVKTDADAAHEILSTNLLGAVWGCKIVGKQMVREKRRGCIINISSLLAVKGAAGTSVYAASKAGLLGLTTSLVSELGRFGIRVNAILPGYIETAMVHNVRNRIPSGRFGTVDEVADAAAFLAKNEYANNCMLNLDGGLSAT
ncbi:NAD(P)-binding protein [Thozetella sp. PMI_491]|nr:NAD(P)-binding protein [Thozetella sp. PMI_491]